MPEPRFNPLNIPAPRTAKAWEPEEQIDPKSDMRKQLVPGFQTNSEQAEATRRESQNKFNEERQQTRPLFSVNPDKPADVNQAVKNLVENWLTTKDTTEKMLRLVPGTLTDKRKVLQDIIRPKFVELLKAVQKKQKTMEAALVDLNLQLIAAAEKL